MFQLKYRFLSLMVALVVFGAPATSQAGGFRLEPPVGTIGVTEASFLQIKQAHCSYDYCDSFLMALSEQVIMRVEHGGALYKVHSGDGLPRVTRYLPDGFYKTKHKYYWLNNGYRQEITEQSFWSTLMNVAQHPDGVRVTPVSYNDISILFQTCDGNDELQFLLCEQNLQQLRAGLVSKLRGKVLQNVEGDGELYYLDSLYGIQKIDTDFFKSFIQENAISIVLDRLIRQLPPQ